MNLMIIGLCGVLAYLLGSIPTAIWYGEAYYGIDIREHGSGNAGATNTFRVLGKRAGMVVIFIDVLKGWVATSLAMGLYYLHLVQAEERVYLKLIFGFLAVLGHLLPFWANFKGGKGVATLLGMVISLHPLAAVVCLFIFLLIFSLSHYVSLGSMLACVSFPTMLTFQLFGEKEPVSLVGFGCLMSFLLFYTHRKNIRKLIDGTESKIYLWKKNKQVV
jgi:acyl phosphate:glycerol-3-phosphate acyltransferase